MGQTGTGEHTFFGRNIPDHVLTGQLRESWEVITDPLSIVWHVRLGVYWQPLGKEHVMETRELTADDFA